METPTIAANRGTAQIAREIPAPDRASYAKLAKQELAAFVDLLNQLEPDDWGKPTPCALWDVKDVVAHQAGHVQMGSGLRGFMAQLSPRPLASYRKRGMSMLDALNQRQVDIRRERTPAELIAEVRDGTPRSITSRGRLNVIARSIRVPAPPVGYVGLGTLLHRIFPRDMWIHRLDIADATGKPFVQTPGHDDVMVALTVADAARFVEKKAPGLSFTLTLSGPAGGSWAFGQNEVPEWELRMDVTDFMRRSSGRIDAEEAFGRTESTAPEAATRACLEALQALY
ncbi:MAG: maleylpyruvate isomerase family mycothiol-dependent enzyme [Dehalococcoidia bacterium]|nr:maleylpyruvate isomerase family mycothiol-dependent enzyme [Dehalococcoidia bacterium]